MTLKYDELTEIMIQDAAKHCYERMCSVKYLSAVTLHVVAGDETYYIKLMVRTDSEGEVEG